MNPLQSLADYERFIYTLQELYPALRRSTLVVIRRGRIAALLTGELEIGSYRIIVREKLSFVAEPGQITSYGYEIWSGDQKLFWYDSQPHPADPALAASEPHHKHIPPDIKHHRVPASEMSFTQPNLPILIREIEQIISG
jgi:hypothetical protein